jgi:hypothetical protein
MIYKFRGIYTIVQVNSFWRLSLRTIFSHPRKFLFRMWHNRSIQKPYIVDFLCEHIQIFFSKLDAIKEYRGSQLIIDFWSYVEGFSMMVII